MSTRATKSSWRCATGFEGEHNEPTGSTSFSPPASLRPEVDRYSQSGEDIRLLPASCREDEAKESLPIERPREPLVPLGLPLLVALSLGNLVTAERVANLREV